MSSEILCGVEAVELKRLIVQLKWDESLLW